MHLLSAATDLANQYVLVRTSCNVPIHNGHVANAYRLKQAIPTLEYLRAVGAKTVLLAHIGRETTDTLFPVCTAFNRLIPVTWGGSVGSEEAATIHAAMKPGDIMMLENLRQDPREALGDEAFALELAAYGSVYINDAFDNIHRDHTSMTLLPRLMPAFAGLTLEHEVKNITKAMQPETPSLFIIGGAKFETKLPLIAKYLKHYDHVFVGGALANDVLKALGHEVGRSLISPISLADEPFLKSPKLLIPLDVIVESERGVRVAAIDDVASDEKITDMGPGTVAMLAPYIANAKTILWNGPVGLYENGKMGATQALAKHIAVSPAFSVLGGGDTVAAVEELGLNDQFGFVSTGGGAMLTLLEAGNTPALKALGYHG